MPPPADQARWFSEEADPHRGALRAHVQRFPRVSGWGRPAGVVGVWGQAVDMTNLSIALLRSSDLSADERYRQRTPRNRIHP